ncbi:MAG: four helix bundle protein [Chryseobacterium sp.]|nr:MAG: four helix bundle protein [Chryseobacterium sp.]
MNYRDLDIYKIAMELFFDIHPLSLVLPRYELYELGSQLRRSADSVVTNIVEGYGRRRYKAEYIRFLVFSHSSNDETINHLEKLQRLYPEHAVRFQDLIKQYNILGAKLNSYIRYVEQNWKS